MALRNPPSWMQQGTHPAENDRLTTTAAIFPTSGTVGASSMTVSALGSPNSTVNIAAGWAAIVGTVATNQGTYIVYNDATFNLAGFASNASGSNRVDAVVVSISDAYYTPGGSNTAAFSIFGGPSGGANPSVTTPNSLVLAYVTIPTGWVAGASTITAGIISDQRAAASSNISKLATSVATSGIVNTGTISSTSNVSMSAGSTLSIGAGTNTVAPIILAAGSNGASATGAAAGAIEFDGKTLDFTPAASSGRAAVGSSYYYSLGANLGRTNTISLQSIFAVGLTLQANIEYEFEVVCQIAIGSAVSKSVQIGYTYSGTYGQAYSHTVANINGTLTNYWASTIDFLNVAAVTATTHTFRTIGRIRTTTTGTWTPSVSYSILPVSVTVQGGSFARVTPVSASTTSAAVAVGAWA